MNYEILQSSSSGNAFLFEEFILLDTGISFKKLNEMCDVSKIKYVLLTHIHGDHFNKTTIRNLYTQTKCKFICGIHLQEHLSLYKDRTKVIESNKPYKLQDIVISAIDLFHDVPNFGYRIMKGKHRHIHATDTFSLDGIVALNYDSATIEANHEPKKALEIIEDAKANGSFSHLVGALNSHLSVYKALDFIKESNIKKFDFVHIGSSTHNEVMEEIKRFKNDFRVC